jgi:hypothetical protein
MVTFQSGPVNLEQGNTANFVIEFFDGTGATFVPPAPIMTISYINTSAIGQTDNIPLSTAGSFFTGTWSSSGSSLCLATYNAVAASTTTPISGQIRILQKQGSS